MSRSNDTKVVQEAMHQTKTDGTLPNAFNARNGKWETAMNGNRQELAFDKSSGKLILKQNNDNPDSVVAIPMAAAGFFSDNMGEPRKFTDSFKKAALTTNCVFAKFGGQNLVMFSGSTEDVTK